MDNNAEVLKVFIGYDHRQAISYTVLQHTIMKLSSKPVAIIPLRLEQLPIERRGLTPFTYSRYLVPWLCNYQGWGLFMDADMILLDDIAKLFELADDNYDMMVVKCKERFEWASMMFFNCEKCTTLTPEYIETASNDELFGMRFANSIGEIPNRWNHCVGYEEKKADPALIHYTQGVPVFEETKGCEYTEEWEQAYAEAVGHQEWKDLMGPSVHSTVYNNELIAKLKLSEHYQKDKERAETLLNNYEYSRTKPSVYYQDNIKQHQELHANTPDSEEVRQSLSGMQGMGLAEQIHDLIQKVQPLNSILDFGSGNGSQYDERNLPLADGRTVTSLKDYWNVDDITEYDPGYNPDSAWPAQKHDLVLCNHVLDRCAEEDIPWMLEEMFKLANKAVFITAIGYPESFNLPNGENARVWPRGIMWWATVLRNVCQRYPDVKLNFYHQDHPNGPINILN